MNNTFLLFISIVTFLKGCEIQAGKIKTTADRIHKWGYNSETHDVTTQDGYIISLFRITSKKNSITAYNNSRPVVLMMHGLVSSSDCWVIGNENKILAFNLADNGYDVWLGNSRGNPYAKRHVTMSPDENRFWRYSWHEIGIFDLPTTIDYILNFTEQDALHYVGHSQGTAILFVLLSSQPNYNMKLKTAHLLAPIAYMSYVASPLIHIGAVLVGQYSALDPLIGDMPFLQQNIVRKITRLDMCAQQALNTRTCVNILYTIAGGISNYFNESLIYEVLETHPASCSTHQAIHLIQLYVSHRFRQYDFGVQGNLQRYGRTTPPDYKVENIQPKYPLHFYYSDYDELSSRKDCEYFAKILGNKIVVKHFIDLKHFAHIDFLWANNVDTVINQGVLKRMNEVELQDVESNKM